MKIYLAGGFPVSNTTGSERELIYHFPIWQRLFSFYFKNCIDKSNIVKIIRDENILSNMASGGSTGGTSDQKKS